MQITDRFKLEISNLLEFSYFQFSRIVYWQILFKKGYGLMDFRSINATYV